MEPSEDPKLIELAHEVFDMARQGEAARLGAYVDAGVPVDMTNAAGDTLVMLAAYHGHAEAVSQLVERGADVNIRNDRGQSPLAGAVFKSEDAVVKTLLAAGANPDAGTPSARDTAKMFGQQQYESWFGATVSDQVD